MENLLRFENRFEAARTLVAPLAKYLGIKGAKGADRAIAQKVLIVAIPRGGLQVGGFVAQKLGLGLDVALVKKLGAPESHELAVGAVGLDGGLVVDKKAAQELGASKAYIEAMQKRLTLDLGERDRFYHAEVPTLAVTDKKIVLVDDGMATGYTVRAAAEMLRRQGAREIILAVPVASTSAQKLVRPVVDKIIATKIDTLLVAVGSHYNNFEQVSDREALKILQENRA